MTSTWVAIAAAGAGTFVFRASFLVFAHRLVDLPPMVDRVLRQVPPAVLAALVLPAFVRPDGHLDLTQPRLFAGLLAAAVGWRTRSVASTLVVGMAALVAIERFV